MERIASFTVDHNKLVPGLYYSRRDGDVVTFDLRFKKPNTGDLLSNSEMHAFHILPSCHAIRLDFGKEAAVFAAEGNDVDVDLIADAHDILCGIRFRISQLFFRNRDFLLVADIDEGLALVDEHDLAFHDLMLPDFRAVLLFFL